MGNAVGRTFAQRTMRTGSDIDVKSREGDRSRISGTHIGPGELMGGHGFFGVITMESYVAEGDCTVLIDAPPDQKIYAAFHAVCRCQGSIESQSLWLEHDVPITPDFSAPAPPPRLIELFDSAHAMVARMELVIAGLRIEFLRSGGHPPFRQSFFDELRLSIRGQILRTKLLSIMSILFASSTVKVVTATGSFAYLLQVSPGNIHPFRHPPAAEVSTGDTESTPQS